MKCTFHKNEANGFKVFSAIFNKLKVTSTVLARFVTLPGTCALARIANERPAGDIFELHVPHVGAETNGFTFIYL